LRAQRSNPASSPASGLLRRFAPRNDVARHESKPPGAGRSRPERGIVWARGERIAPSSQGPAFAKRMGLWSISEWALSARLFLAPACSIGREAAFARIAMNEDWVISFWGSRSARASPLAAADIVLNRGRRRRQKGVEPRLYDRVAFARCLLKAGTIDDLDRPPAVADETGGLHRLRGKRHRFPVDTQHVSQKFVRVGQALASGAIMHHEEPPAQSLFDCMLRIARDGLLNRDSCVSE
jgi:hypothetical protein